MPARALELLIAVSLSSGSLIAGAQTVQQYVHEHGRQFAYRPLAAGGEIRFKTSDIRLITAIHRWFGAQLPEHGADAQAR